MIYKQSNGSYLRLIRQRKSNINTYIDVDINNIPIVKLRDWSVRPEVQERLITGFNNLTKLT